MVKEGGAEEEVECGFGDVATVWDGEVAGMAEGLARTQRERKVLILADSKAAIAAVRKAGKTGKARSSHLKKVVDEIGVRGPGMVKLGWVKTHMGILRNEAADVLAKNASEGVPRKMDAWGGYKSLGQAAEEKVSGGGWKRGRGYWQGDGMATEGSNQLLSAARRKGHGEVVGKGDWTGRRGWVPKMWGGRANSGHIVFRCGKARGVRDERGRGRSEWASENGMRWGSWDALASKKWVRMEESGRVDDEGRPILERVDLMEAFRFIYIDGPSSSTSPSTMSTWAQSSH